MKPSTERRRKNELGRIVDAGSDMRQFEIVRQCPELTIPVPRWAFPMVVWVSQEPLGVGTYCSHVRLLVPPEETDIARQQAGLVPIRAESTICVEMGSFIE